MIFDSVSNILRYSIIPPDAANFIKTANELIKNGRFELQNGCFALVSRYVTERDFETYFEAHKKYIDLQYVLYGSEKMEIMPAAGLSEKTAYDAETDTVFYQNSPARSAISLQLKNGDFALIFPEEAHKTRLMCDDFDNVLKIVIKIPLAPQQNSAVLRRAEFIKQNSAK